MTNPYVAMLYERPWAVDAGTMEAPAGEAEHVLLYRCGHAKAQVVCRTACGAPSLGHGLLVWSQGKTGYVRSLAKQRTTRVQLPGHAIALRLVGRRVIVIADPGTPQARFGLLRQ